MEIETQNLLISGACNVEYEIFDWFGSVIAYGSSNLVYIYDVENVKILATLKGHKGRVNAVKFLKDGKLLSACTEGGFRLWQNEKFTKNGISEFLQNEKFWGYWDVAALYQSNQINFLNFCIEEFDDGSVDIALATTKSDLRFINLKSSEKYEFVVYDTLEFGNNLLETCKFIDFNKSKYLVVSSSDFKIHIYEIVKNENSKCLEYKNSLSGHENKIGAIAAISSDSYSYIATASKDHYIRIWKFSSEVST